MKSDDGVDTRADIGRFALCAVSVATCAMPVIHFLTPQVGLDTAIEAPAVWHVFEVHFHFRPRKGRSTCWESLGEEHSNRSAKVAGTGP